MKILQIFTKYIISSVLVYFISPIKNFFFANLHPHIITLNAFLNSFTGWVILFLALKSANRKYKIRLVIFTFLIGSYAKYFPKNPENNFVTQTTYSAAAQADIDNIKDVDSVEELSSEEVKNIPAEALKSAPALQTKDISSSDKMRTEAEKSKPIQASKTEEAAEEDVKKAPKKEVKKSTKKADRKKKTSKKKLKKRSPKGSKKAPKKGKSRLLKKPTLKQIKEALAKKFDKKDSESILKTIILFPLRFILKWFKLIFVCAIIYIIYKKGLLGFFRGFFEGVNKALGFIKEGVKYLYKGLQYVYKAIKPIRDFLGKIFGRPKNKTPQAPNSKLLDKLKNDGEDDDGEADSDDESDSDSDDDDDDDGDNLRRIGRDVKFSLPLPKIAENEYCDDAQTLDMFGRNRGLEEVELHRFVAGVQWLQNQVRKGHIEPMALALFVNSNGELCLPGEEGSNNHKSIFRAIQDKKFEIHTKRRFAKKALQQKQAIQARLDDIARRQAEKEAAAAAKKQEQRQAIDEQIAHLQQVQARQQAIDRDDLERSMQDEAFGNFRQSHAQNNRDRLARQQKKALAAKKDHLDQVQARQQALDAQAQADAIAKQLEAARKQADANNKRDEQARQQAIDMQAQKDHLDQVAARQAAIDAQKQADALEAQTQAAQRQAQAQANKDAQAQADELKRQRRLKKIKNECEINKKFKAEKEAQKKYFENQQKQIKKILNGLNTEDLQKALEMFSIDKRFLVNISGIKTSPLNLKKIAESILKERKKTMPSQISKKDHLDENAAKDKAAEKEAAAQAKKEEQRQAIDDQIAHLQQVQARQQAIDQIKNKRQAQAQANRDKTVKDLSDSRAAQAQAAQNQQEKNDKAARSQVSMQKIKNDLRASNEAFEAAKRRRQEQIQKRQERIKKENEQARADALKKQAAKKGQMIDSVVDAQVQSVDVASDQVIRHHPRSYRRKRRSGASLRRVRQSDDSDDDSGVDVVFVEADAASDDHVQVVQSVPDASQGNVHVGNKKGKSQSKSSANNTNSGLSSNSGGGAVFTSEEGVNGRNLARAAHAAYSSIRREGVKQITKEGTRQIKKESKKKVKKLIKEQIKTVRKELPTFVRCPGGEYCVVANPEDEIEFYRKIYSWAKKKLFGETTKREVKKEVKKVAQKEVKKQTVKTTVKAAKTTIKTTSKRTVKTTVKTTVKASKSLGGKVLGWFGGEMLFDYGWSAVGSFYTSCKEGESWSETKDRIYNEAPTIADSATSAAAGGVGTVVGGAAVTALGIAGAPALAIGAGVTAAFSAAGSAFKKWWWG